MKWALALIVNTMVLFLVIKNWSSIKRYFLPYYKLMILALLLAAVIFSSCLIYEGRLWLKAFFTDYRHVFTGIGYLAVAVGLALTILQISDVKKKAKSRFSYQIYKDGREIMKSTDKEFYCFIKSENISHFDEEQHFKANAKIGELLQYYACAYEQWAYHNNLEEREWHYILEELYGLLKEPQVEAFWNEKIRKNRAWDGGFRATAQEFFDRKGDCS